MHVKGLLARSHPGRRGIPPGQKNTAFFYLVNSQPREHGNVVKSTILNDLIDRREVQHSPVAYGYARLDAFGNILNQVTVFALNLRQNKKAPDAPVSYPFVWDTPHHDVVQWNGSASNSPQGAGPLSRNTGEVLGVFGHLKIKRKWWWPWSRVYESSVNMVNLGKLEKQLESLWSPVWPDQVLGALDRSGEQFAKGKELYAAKCSACHTEIVRNDPARRIKAKMVKVTGVGTDSTMSHNFLSNIAATGILEGQKTRLFSGEKFGPTAPAGALLVNSVIGTMGRHPVEAAKAIREDWMKVPDAAEFDPASYKGRPLNGIWATAPFLHNGSVPNLWELLKPEDQRVKTFYVGSREFDPQHVGFISSQTPGAFEFDTSLKANSNKGHSGPAYGTAMSDDDKRALLNYLKTL